jgi:hypothetical protein
MVVAGDELDPAQATLNQAVQKGPPMHLSLGQRHRDTQHPAVWLATITLAGALTHQFCYR